MSILTKHLDFWLGDFKWYRNLTESDKVEWLCRNETSIYGGESRTWERHPRGTFFMISIVKKMVQENPNIKSMSEEEQRQIAEKYINLHYNNQN